MDPACKVNETAPPDENTAVLTEDSSPVTTVREPIQAIDHDGKAEGHPKLASKETAMQEAIGGGPETEEIIVNPLPEVAPAGM